MKKVLFVATITNHIIGFHTPYLKCFQEQGYEVHVASKGNETIPYCDKHYEIPFARFPLNKDNLKAYKQLKKIIDENNYEIIHCHTPVGGALARLAGRDARKKGTRIIYTAHGFHFYKGAPLKNWIIYYPIEKWLAKYTDTLITITQEDYECAKKRLKKVKNIKLIHGVGLNTKKFDEFIKEEEKEKLKNEIEIKKEDIVLSYVAELNDNKNQILLINAVKELTKENKNYKLLLIGDGLNKEKYADIIQKNNLQNNIKLLGKRLDVPRLLAITDIYVASSIREGLPVNIMEAMYVGLPIVATDNRGHRELIKNKINGLLIENDVNALIKSIRKINNHDLIKKFAENNRKIIEKYKIENVIVEMKKIYKL